MYLFKKNINSIFLTNLIFAFFPASFILGNLAININTLLFCCFGIFQLRSKIFSTKLDIYIKIISLFFFIVFLSTSISFIRSLFNEGYQYENLERLIKSIVFFRFFLMLLIIYLLNEFNIIKFKYLFISATFLSLLLSLDIIFQYFLGFDFIGLKSHVHYNTGFFGDEIIAGSFLLRFSFFSIFLIAYIFNSKNNLRFALTTLTISVLGVGVLFSGNRMPLILFFFGLMFTFLFRIKLKKIITAGLIVLIIIFNFIFSSNQIYNDKFKSFFGNAITYGLGQITNTSENIKKFENLIFKENITAHKKTDSEKLPNLEKEILAHDLDLYWVNRLRPQSQEIGSGHKWLYYTALDTWRLHKVFGNGIKSFRIDCGKFIGYPYFRQRLCSSHPHNYYLEILTETGIAGLSLTIIIAVMFLAYLFKNFKFFKGNSLQEYILLSAAISLFLEFFPLRSTGSLFSTNSATYIILVASIILCHKKMIKTENVQ